MRHAMVSALSSATASAAASRTLVEPRRPQPPATGTKISGYAATTTACCSGKSLTKPQPASG